jgi:uncharacterized membrane protein
MSVGVRLLKILLGIVTVVNLLFVATMLSLKYVLRNPHWDGFGFWYFMYFLSVIIPAILLLFISTLIKPINNHTKPLFLNFLLWNILPFILLFFLASINNLPR